MDRYVAVSLWRLHEHPQENIGLSFVKEAKKLQPKNG
jgi:hypothetical protein